MIYLVTVIIIIIIVLILSNKREHYTDPIWLSRRKLLQDYYPRSNGSIYTGEMGKWTIFSGFPQYYSAY